MYDMFMNKNSEKWLNQLKKGILELSVLLILKKGDSYGYEIVKTMNQLEAFTISQAAIYPVLKRLLTAQYITSYWVEVENNPARKYYKITEEGISLLTQRMVDYESLYTAIQFLDKEL